MRDSPPESRGCSGAVSSADLIYTDHGPRALFKSENLHLKHAVNPKWKPKNEMKTKMPPFTCIFALFLAENRASLVFLLHAFAAPHYAWLASLGSLRRSYKLDLGSLSDLHLNEFD